MDASSDEGRAYAYARAQGYAGSPLDFHAIYAAAGRAPAKGNGGSGGSGAAGYAGQYQGTIARAANKMSSVSGSKQMEESLQGAIAAGDYATAAGLIVDASTAGLTAENRTKVQNAAIDNYSLQQMSSALQAYKDAGGNMNIFKGTADNIGKSIGVLATDPKYAEIGVQLDRAFQQYRQNMTGAAFSPAESKQYAKVIPQKSNNLDLNLATINGALNYNNNYVKGAINAATGSGGVDIYERGVKGEQGPVAQAVQKQGQQTQTLAEWVAASPQNASQAQFLAKQFPNASPEDIAQMLGI